MEDTVQRQMLQGFLDMEGSVWKWVSDPTKTWAELPEGFLRLYAIQATEVLRSKFLDAYKSSYTVLCDKYLKASSSSVNEAIAEYVQITRAMTSDNYQSSSSAKRARDEHDRLRHYERSKEIFSSTDRVFQEEFRKPYLENTSTIKAFMEQYRKFQHFDSSTPKESILELFVSSRNETREIRRRIDNHLKRLLDITGLEANIHNGASPAR